MNQGLYDFLKNIKTNMKNTLFIGIFFILGGFVFQSLYKLYGQIAVAVGFIMIVTGFVAFILVKEKVEQAPSFLETMNKGKVIEGKKVDEPNKIEDSKKEGNFLDNLQSGLNDFGSKVDENVFEPKERGK